MPEFGGTDTFWYVEAIKRVVWHLKRIPLFEGADDGLLTDIAVESELRNVRRRQVLYLPGDPGDTLYFVHEGRVKVSKVTRDGKALTLCYSGAGDFFGESSLAALGPREEMAECMETATLSEVPSDVLKRLVTRSPIVCLRMAEQLAERNHQLGKKLETLVYRDVRAKLAELLLQLADEYGVEDARGTRLGLKITHQELANLIGATRETVSLTLAQFKRSDLICTEGRRVIISDSDSLRALF